jgi:hypothetical protein
MSEQKDLMNEQPTKKNPNYAQRQEARRYTIVMQNCRLVGIWGNLKKCCDDMKARDAAFLSYSSLSKKRADTDDTDAAAGIAFATEQGEYLVYIERLR